MSKNKEKRIMLGEAATSILDEYCETTNKTKAEVIEELINSLEKAN